MAPKFSALASMGGTFGTIFIYPAVGLLLEASGWKAVFYLGGAVSFAWCGIHDSRKCRNRHLLFYCRVVPGLRVI